MPYNSIKRLHIITSIEIETAIILHVAMMENGFSGAALHRVEHNYPFPGCVQVIAHHTAVDAFIILCVDGAL